MTKDIGAAERDKLRGKIETVFAVGAVVNVYNLKMAGHFRFANRKTRKISKGYPNSVTYRHAIFHKLIAEADHDMPSIVFASPKGA